MKSTIVFLLGLLVVSYAEDDEDSGEQFSWDSQAGDDADGQATQSYDGFVVQVYLPADGDVTITLSENREADKVYCLEFTRIFEATYGESAAVCTTDCAYTVVADSEVDLATANCAVTHTSTTFTAVCTPANATLRLSFEFKQRTEDSEYGLKYQIELREYSMKNPVASFVIEQRVRECSDEYASSGDSGSADENEEDTTGTRRRILSDEDGDGDSDEDEDEDDSDSENEADGISSDDSNELDIDEAQFFISGLATDDCSNDACVAVTEPTLCTQTDYRMVYQRQSQSAQIVFPAFQCVLRVDPWFKLDGSKISAANTIQYVTASVCIALVAMFLF